MISQTLIPLDCADKWRIALDGISHGFAHTWENAFAMHLTTGRKTFLYCFESGSTRIVCPIAERAWSGHRGIVTPYGFSGFAGNGDCADFPHYWAEFARAEGYVDGYLSLHPIFANPAYYRAADAYPSSTLYLLDLSLSLDELFRNFDSNRKRELRNAASDAGSVTYDKHLVGYFVTANRQLFLRSVRASKATYWSKATLAFLCSLDNCLLVGVTGPDGIEAASMFVYNGAVAEWLLSVRVPSGRKQGSKLLWAAIQRLKALGVSALNLGGGVKDGDAVAQAKQRFGPISTAGICLKQVYDRDTFVHLCQLANCDPDDYGDYFPPYARA